MGEAVIIWIIVGILMISYGWDEINLGNRAKGARSILAGLFVPVSVPILLFYGFGKLVKMAFGEEK